MQAKNKPTDKKEEPTLDMNLEQWHLPLLVCISNYHLKKHRFLSEKFYAKAKEKTESVQTLLMKEVTVCETSFWPKLEDIVTPVKDFTCALNSILLTGENKEKSIVSREKHIIIFFGKPCSSISVHVEKEVPSLLQVKISPSLTVSSCITDDNELTLSLVEEEKI